MSDRRVATNTAAEIVLQIALRFVCFYPGFRFSCFLKVASMLYTFSPLIFVFSLRSLPEVRMEPFVRFLGRFQVRKVIRI